MTKSDRECGFYMFYHEASGKAYVGSTVDLKTREETHRRFLELGTHKNKALQQAFNADQRLEFLYVPLESREEAFDAEQTLINEYYSQGLLFNKALDARYCGKGLSPSEETRKKMSDWQMGKKHSAETLQKLKEKAQGRVPSSAAIEAARVVNIGRKMSAEEAQRISARNKVPVQVGEVVYGSLFEAAAAHGITSASAHHRIHSSNPLFSEWRYAAK